MRIANWSPIIRLRDTAATADGSRLSVPMKSKPCAKALFLNDGD